MGNTVLARAGLFFRTRAGDASPLARHGAIMFVSMAGVYAADYLFHVSMSRLLGPSDYGALVAFSAILLILYVPVNTIQTAMARHTAYLDEAGQWTAIGPLAVRTMRYFFWYGALGCVALALMSPTLSALLRIDDPLPMITLSGRVLIATTLPVVRGAFQGLQMFVPLGVNLVLEHVSKLAMGIVLAWAGWGLTGAVAGMVLGGAVALAAALAAFRPLVRAGGETPLSPVVRSAGAIAVAMSLFLVATNVDVLLVKALFAPAVAGYYAAAGVAAKIILYATWAIPAVVFPEMVRGHARQGGGHQFLFKGLAASALGAGGLLTAYLVAPDLVIRILFGSSFLPAAPLLGILGFGMTAYQFVFLMMSYEQARGRNRTFPFAMLACIVGFVASLGVLRAASLTQVAWLMALWAWIMCGWMAWLVLWPAWTEQARARRPRAAGDA
ncbi:MAG: oligosaccharide flippase family protein [Armatimonadetes bacterium]|nr:oligosaccharide flippase family protein [Armatimonadota bacterium]